MTEEDPVVRKRIFRNKIYQAILVLAGLQSLYFTFQSRSTPLNEWPADLSDHSAYCKPEAYKACHEGQWFGVLKSRVPQTGVLKDICQDWADKPDAAHTRMIEAADGDTLYLCRMKDPAKIDAAKMPR